MNKIICLLLIFAFVIPLVSCKTSSSYINGVHLKKYSIVYSDEDLDYSKRAAEYIQSEIQKRTNISIPLVEDSEKPKTKHEIVVGNTERDISAQLDAETEGFEFAILANENSIALEGDYFIIAAAAYYFMSYYVPFADYEATVPNEVMVHTPIVKEAKNFILLIGDGMGVNHTTLFDGMDTDVEFSDGEDFFYGYLFPSQGFARTHSRSGVTDSAAAGTALATGTKTTNGRIGRDKDGNDLKSLTELAFELGMNGGVMSTDAYTGATPSAFCSHADNRNDTTIIQNSQTNAKKEFGTYIKCNFNYYKQIQMKIVDSHIDTALESLTANGKNFFLMYEEAHIDKHSHNNDMDKAYEAVVRFNQAIGHFMEYVFYNPDTFILITADHECGDLYPDENGVYAYHETVHTSADVPVFAFGMGAELFNGKTVENIQIAQTIAHMMGESDFGDQSVFKSLLK